MHAAPHDGRARPLGPHAVRELEPVADLRAAHRGDADEDRVAEGECAEVAEAQVGDARAVAGARQRRRDVKQLERYLRVRSAAASREDEQDVAVCGGGRHRATVCRRPILPSRPLMRFPMPTPRRLPPSPVAGRREKTPARRTCRRSRCRRSRPGPKPGMSIALPERRASYSPSVGPSYVREERSVNGCETLRRARAAGVATREVISRPRLAGRTDNRPMPPGCESSQPEPDPTGAQGNAPRQESGGRRHLRRHPPLWMPGRFSTAARLSCVRTP